MLDFLTINSFAKYSLHLFNTNYTFFNTIYIIMFALYNNIYDFAKKLE